jgi:hypothetical protein
MPKPSEPAASKPASAVIDDAFIKEVAALPAEQQVARVVGKLKQLNPGYDGKESHKIEKGRVVGLIFKSAALENLSPIRAFGKLDFLICSGEGCPTRCPFSDLAVVKGLPLQVLNCNATSVADLSPLRGMQLAQLVVVGTYVTDLAPLQGMPVNLLHIALTKVSDLSPLRGAPLTMLWCFGTRVTDLSPVKDSPLKDLRCDFDPKRDTEILRSIKTLENINGLPAAEFWKQVEAGKMPSPYNGLGN